MVRLRLARAAALVWGVLVFAPGLAAEAASSDPAGFVASIYANGREPAVWEQWLDGGKRGQWFSTGVTALWAQCDRLARKTRDQLGPLDFDIATNSQGAEVKRFAVRTVAQDPGRARVVATLEPDAWGRRSARENAIRYDLVWERGGWAIDDVRSVVEPNAWSLRALLTHYLAE